MMIIGHQKQLKLIKKSLARSSQAFLFCGPEGVGKFTIALQTAQKIAGSDRPNHPDIYVLKPEIEEKRSVIKEKDIKIGSIREAQKFLALTPMAAKTKVLIIDQAHRLTTEAQNSLLKTLEEPNKTSLIILVTCRKERILPTIISRVRAINFGLLGEDEMQEFARLPETLRVAMRAGENLKENLEDSWLMESGRPGWLIGKQAIFAEASREINQIFERDAVKNMDLAQELSKNVPEALEKLKFYAGIARTICLAENANRNMAFKFMLEIGKTIKLLRDTQINARLALENLFLTI